MRVSGCTTTFEREAHKKKSQDLNKQPYCTCLRWFFKMVPSGSGKCGISSAPRWAGVSLFESKSTSQISSGSLRMIRQSRKKWDTMFEANIVRKGDWERLLLVMSILLFNETIENVCIDFSAVWWHVINTLISPLSAMTVTQKVSQVARLAVVYRFFIRSILTGPVHNVRLIQVLVSLLALFFSV